MPSYKVVAQVVQIKDGWTCGTGAPTFHVMAVNAENACDIGRMVVDAHKVLEVHLTVAKEDGTDYKAMNYSPEN